jgi:ribosomal protein S18 acetylase RimI-like enzyme
VPHLRIANPQDAAALAQIAEATFRATFGATNSSAHMDAHCRESYSAALQAAELADPNMATWVAEHAGDLVAYAQLRWGTAPACVRAQRPGEIYRFYVADAWHGKGIAQQLMQACIAAISQRGCDGAWLGVWERNPRAISFYQKFGFREVGEHSFDLGGDLQRDLVMARSIDQDMVEQPVAARPS